MTLKKIVLAMGSCIALSSTVMATDMTQFQVSGSVDFAAFGYGGMRGGDGTGTITVSGVTGTVTQAILYWNGPTNDSVNSDVNANVTFNGTAVTGTHIGESAANCWAFTNTRGYRADVTALVTGDGTYNLADFIKTPDADINGVALFVLFDDGNSANDTDLVIFEGNDSNQDFPGEANGWNATLSGIDYSSGTANMLMVVADGQAFSDNGVSLNGTFVFPSNSPNFEGDTVPNGPTAAATNGGLWDHKNVDVTSLLTPGPNTLTLATDGTGSDCLSLVSLAFTFPPGSVAPPPPPPPAPGNPEAIPTMSSAALALLSGLISLVAFGLGWRRRK